MSGLLKILLISHIFLGLAGIIASYAVWMGLLKKKISVKFLRLSSLVSLVFFLLSWLTGGYYYAVYYGQSVRGVIKSGSYPWAHSIFMEAKEHIFFFIPFLAAVIFIIFYFLNDEIESDGRLKKAAMFLAGLTTILGIVITVSGLIISGAVR